MPFPGQELADAWLNTLPSHEASYLSQLFEQESNNDPNARSGTGAVGRGQITSGTWRDTVQYASRNLSEDQLPEGLTFEQLSDPSSFDQMATNPFVNTYMTWANMKRLESFALEGGGAIDGINDKRIRSGGEASQSLLDAVGGDPRQWATIVGAGHKDGMGRMQLFTDDSGNFDFTPAREFYTKRREAFQQRAQQARTDADGLRATGNIEEADALAQRARALASSDSTGHVFGFADRLSTRVAADAGLDPLDYSPAEVADFIELRAPGHTLENPSVARFAAQAQAQGLNFEDLRGSAAQIAQQPDLGPDLTGAQAAVDLPNQQGTADFDLPPVAGLPPQVQSTDAGFQTGGQEQSGALAPNPIASAPESDVPSFQPGEFLTPSVGTESLGQRIGQGIENVGQSIAGIPGAIDNALNISGTADLIGQGAQNALDFTNRGLIQPIQETGRNIELGIQQGGQLLNDIGGSIGDFAFDVLNPNGPSAADLQFDAALTGLLGLSGNLNVGGDPLDTLVIDAGLPQEPFVATPENTTGVFAPEVAGPQVQQAPQGPGITEEGLIAALAQTRLGTLSPQEFDAITSLNSQQRDAQAQYLRDNAIALAANQNIPRLRNNETALENLDAGGITADGTGAALRELAGGNDLRAPTVNFGAINSFINADANGTFQSRAGSQVANQFAQADPFTASRFGKSANIFDPFDAQLGRVTAGLNAGIQQNAVSDLLRQFGADAQAQADDQLAQQAFGEEVRRLLGNQVQSLQTQARIN